MKMRITLIAMVAVILGANTLWFVPCVLSTPTNDVNSVDPKILYYTCPMHPSVKSDKPGDCPECGMELRPVYANTTGTNAAPPLPSRGDSCCGGI